MPTVAPHKVSGATIRRTIKVPPPPLEPLKPPFDWLLPEMGTWSRWSRARQTSWNLLCRTLSASEFSYLALWRWLKVPTYWMARDSFSSPVGFLRDKPTSKPSGSVTLELFATHVNVTWTSIGITPLSYPLCVRATTRTGNNLPEFDNFLALKWFIEGDELMFWHRARFLR